MKKIAIIVKTSGLEFDDRVRKVSIALSKKYNVKIFVLLNNNTFLQGITSYGVEFESIKLLSREVFPSTKFLTIKMLEFYCRLRNKIRNYDYIWANEESTFIFPLLSKKNSFIWDLHEIPNRFITGYKRIIFQYIERKSLKIVHANPQRIKFLAEKFVINKPEKHDYIHNYPDETFIDSYEKPSIYNDFISWLSNDKYIYLQGLFGAARFPYNTIASIIEQTEYKILVVGNVHPESLLNLKKEYGDKIKKRLFNAGMVNQLAIPILLKKSIFSIVLYETSKPNNRFCEANRLYQSISLGVPVIVGKNESMSEVVQGKYGIVMKTDGSDINELKESIDKLSSDIEFYKSNCIKHSKDYIWKDEYVNYDWFNNK